MLIRFDVQKAAQAAALLYSVEHADPMTRLRLLKLLYIADRESVRETARPITGDELVAMDNGPVLSGVYDCIKGRPIPGAEHWRSTFTNSGLRVELKGDPGLGRLSRYEVEKLRSTAQKYASWSTNRIRAHTHTFPEWAQNFKDGTSSSISEADLLEATGWGAEKDEIIAEARGYEMVDALLGEQPA